MDMESEDLARLDRLCFEVFNSNDQTQRNAQEVLFAMQFNLSLFTSWLQRVQSPFTVLFAAQRLKDHIARGEINKQEYTDQFVMSIATFLLEWLDKAAEQQLFPQEFAEQSYVIVQAVIRVYSLWILTFWMQCEGVKESLMQFLKTKSTQVQMNDFYGQKWLQNRIVGEMLIALVVDMQPPVGNYCRIRRRKCIEFRDSILYPILEWGLLKTESVVQIIEVFKSKNENISDASKILELALNLISKCLSFDFLGAAMENSSETQSVVQIPSSWICLKHPSVIQLLFSCTEVLNCIDSVFLCVSHLVAFKPSYFETVSEKNSFRAEIIKFWNHVFPKVLSSSSIPHHSICRAISSLGLHNSLLLLHETPLFSDLFTQFEKYTSTMMFAFDVELFENCIHYLLVFWAEVSKGLNTVVTVDTIYSHSDEEDTMAINENKSVWFPERTARFADDMPPLISINDTNCIFYTGKLNSVGIWIVESNLSYCTLLSESLDDLSDHSSDSESTLMMQIMKPNIHTILPLIQSLWFEIKQKWESALVEKDLDLSERIEIIRESELKLSFLVYCIGSFVDSLSSPSSRPIIDYGRLSTNAILYADAAFMVFGVMEWLQSHHQALTSFISNNGNDSNCPGHSFELASLHLCLCIHAVCNGDNAETPVALNFLKTLASHMGVVESGDSMLEVMVIKIIADLSTWNSSERICDRAISALESFSMGLKVVYGPNRLPQVYSNGRVLLDGKYIQSLLNTTNSNKFSYMNSGNWPPKLRKRFWSLLSRLFFMQKESVTDANFVGFLSPISAMAVELEKAINSTSDGSLSEQNQIILVAFITDIRGVFSASRTASSFQILMKFLLQECSFIWDVCFRLHQNIWNGNSKIKNNLLKLMSELSDNALRRYSFSSNPEVVAVVLFRKIAIMLDGYSQVIAVNTSGPMQYETSFSCLRSMMEIVINVIAGEYLHIRLMDFYGDPSIKIFFRTLCLAMSATPADILAYPVMSKVVFSFIEYFSPHFPQDIIKLESSGLLLNYIYYIMHGIETSPQLFTTSIASINAVLLHMIKKLHGPLFVEAFETSSYPTMPEMEKMLFESANEEENTTQNQNFRIFITTCFPDMVSKVITRLLAFPYAKKADICTFLFCCGICNGFRFIHASLYAKSLPLISETDMSKKDINLMSAVDFVLEPLQNLVNYNEIPLLDKTARRECRDLFESRLDDFCIEMCSATEIAQSEKVSIMHML